MKPFLWDDEDLLLREQRHISFQEIVEFIQSGSVIEVIDHPHPERYKGQKIVVVEIEGYVWLVPYIETETHRILKTAFPSRKATRRYLRGKND